MTATLIVQYLGQGLAAARPAIPSIDTGSVGWYYATDTDVLSLYADGAWKPASLPDSPTYTFPFPAAPTLTDSQAFGSRGTILTPFQVVTVSAMYAMFTAVNTGVYKMGVAPFNTGTGKMTANPTYTNTFTATASGLASIALSFAAPVTLTAGTVYLFFIVRTDVVGSTALDMVFSASITNSPKFLPLAASTGVAQKTASNNPTTADTWTAGNAMYPTLPIYQ